MASAAYLLFSAAMAGASALVAKDPVFDLNVFVTQQVAAVGIFIGLYFGILGMK